MKRYPIHRMVQQPGEAHVEFLFEGREPSQTLRYVSESVMREVDGDRTVDEVITIGHQGIEMSEQDKAAMAEYGIPC